MVAFGAAPALIAYIWALKDLGTLGWIGAFIYCAGAGIRLARFNANIAVVDKRYFQGLPSPSGAAVMAGLVWVLADFGFDADAAWLAVVTWVVAVFAGITMVSNVPFWSFKEVNWKKRVPLWVILACVIAISVDRLAPLARAVRRSSCRTRSPATSCGRWATGCARSCRTSRFRMNE